MAPNEPRLRKGDKVQLGYPYLDELDIILKRAIWIKLTIPCLPDFDLSSNRRRTRHVMAQMRDTKTEMERAYVYLLQAMQECSNGAQLAAVLDAEGPWSLHWTLHFPKGERARDWDNCVPALKVWQDAMVGLRLGWFPGDSPRYIPTGSVTVGPNSPEGPGMTLKIEEVLKP